MNLIRRIYWILVRCLLHLRYSVQMSGQEKLGQLRGATLVMPNHPGYIDPPIVLSHLQLSEPLRPLVFSGTYRMPFLYPFMRLVEAFEVPDMQSHSKNAKAQAEQLIDAVASQLEAGNNILMYPSGRIQRGDVEVIGGARAASDLLQRCPDVNVVLVRTRGVWGSMFSCAETGTVPNLAERSMKSLGWALLSGILFLPRRKVTLEIEVVSGQDFVGLDKVQINQKLEAWYNQDGGQSPQFVRYHHWFGPSEGKFHDGHGATDCCEEDFSPEVRQLVLDILAERLHRPLETSERHPAVTLDSLGVDSLDRMEIALAIEDRFGFRSDQVASTIGELYQLASGQFAPATHEAIEIPVAWQQAAKQDAEPTVLDDTIAAAFVKQCLASKDRAAVADLMSGVLSYRRLLVGALAMKRRFEQLDGEAVGLLLPASVAADTSFFALQMAGKLPVLLNWTTGPTALRHAVEKLGIKKVVTSHKFVDRMGIEVEGAEFVYLEDLRKSIGKFELIGLLAKTYLAGSSLLNALPPQSADDAAVVLFTSGSESLPKAVPLTHGNLISNIKGGLPSMKFRTSDALLGFLPPFHSFGLTGNMLLAILSGIRVVHHPDPTDAAGLTRIIAAFRPSLLFSTPTFLSYILNADKENAVSSLRIVVTGAEKCPASLVERSRDAMPDATILEGYGITECSPVVSINQPARQKHGTIGLPLSNVQTCVVDADSLQPVGSNETGLLLVAGPSVFHGYLHYDGPSPFVEVDGQAWYNTGDLVAIDDDGFIHFKGRMKRFIKSGGEMISLPALEEPFLNHFPPTEDGPQIAVEGIETPGGRLIALFTTVQIELKRANEILTAAGFRGIMRIDEVRSIDSIPVLGTGKTDYKQLRSALQDTTLDSSLA